jgi:hypothetical protein
VCDDADGKSQSAGGEPRGDAGSDSRLDRLFSRRRHAAGWNVWSRLGWSRPRTRCADFVSSTRSDLSCRLARAHYGYTLSLGHVACQLTAASAMVGPSATWYDTGVSMFRYWRVPGPASGAMSWLECDAIQRMDSMVPVRAPDCTGRTFHGRYWSKRHRQRQVIQVKPL